MRKGHGPATDTLLYTRQESDQGEILPSLTQFVCSSRLDVSGNPPLKNKNHLYHLNEEILRAKTMPHGFK